MSEIEIPSGDGIRERLLVEVDALRQRYVSARNGQGGLSWLEVDYWIDRERWLVLPVDMAERRGFREQTTVPEAQYDAIEYFGCRKSPTTVWQMIRVLAVYIGGRGNRPPGAATNFLNFAVVQPLLNPAFDSLFWLGLAWQMRPGREEQNLGEAIGEMAIDLSRYPASRAEMPDVRKAQVEFAKSVFDPNLDVAEWTRAGEADWAAHCRALMHARRDDVDHVFFEIEHTARRIRTDPAG